MENKDIEVGVVTAHPLKQMCLQVKTVWVTWMYCRKNNLPCNKWYGVYPVKSEKIIAQTGCLPESESRAKLIAEALSV